MAQSLRGYAHFPQRVMSSNRFNDIFTSFTHVNSTTSSQMTSPVLSLIHI